MSSSYRSDMADGLCAEWSEPLRDCVDTLYRIAAEVRDCACEEDVSEDAADDGGLFERLSIAAQLINAVLPTSADKNDE